jgi:hypothetical protein
MHPTMNWSAAENYCKVVVPKLGQPKIKGKNHLSRTRLSAIVPNALVPRLDAIIPASHKSVVSIYRGKGFGGPKTFVADSLASELRVQLYTK